jgi:uncharacterized protein YegJ (DUF2314 family)
MTRNFLRGLLAAFAMAAIVLAGSGNCGARAESINVPSGDAEMNAAIKQARATLPEFWRAMAAPGPGENGFSLKVRIVDHGKAEHIWFDAIERKGNSLTGVVTNTPEAVTTVKWGQRYEIGEAAISDWLYMRNGKFVGNRTLRVLLKQMPKAEADRYRAMFEKP